MAPDCRDEPEEGDAREGDDIQTDERHLALLVLEVEIRDLGGARAGGGASAQKQDRGDEQRREDEAGDTGGPRRLEAALHPSAHAAAPWQCFHLRPDRHVHGSFLPRRASSAAYTAMI